MLSTPGRGRNLKDIIVQDPSVGQEPFAWLHPTHREWCIERGIAEAVAQKRGVESLARDGAGSSRLGELGYGPQVPLPGLLLPLWGIDGKVWGSQYKPNVPRKDPKTGKAHKYENPIGQKTQVDVSPVINGRLHDPSVRKFPVEGAFKADALASNGEVGINVGGVNGSPTVWEQLDALKWEGCSSYITFDSDGAVKKEVKQAEQYFVTFLERRKAAVWIIPLPPGADGAKQGPDDYLAAGGTIEGMVGLAVRPDEEVRRERRKWHVIDMGARREAEREVLAEEAGPLQALDAFDLLYGEPPPPDLWEGLWGEGQSLEIGADTGNFKTTLAVLLYEGLLGLRDEVLGIPISGDRTGVYLAIDRPQQIYSALRRRFPLAQEKLWRPKLKVFTNWNPSIHGRDPAALRRLVESAGGSFAIIDTADMLVPGIGTPEGSEMYDRLRNETLRAGIDVLGLQGVRKSQGRRNGLHKDDLYGAVHRHAGSIILLDKTGPSNVSLRLTKPIREPAPVGEEGWSLKADHQTGLLERGGLHIPAASQGPRLSQTQAAILRTLKQFDRPVSATEVAVRRFETDRPTGSQKTSVRDRLGELYDLGLKTGRVLVERHGEGGQKTPFLWSATATQVT